MTETRSYRFRRLVLISCAIALAGYHIFAADVMHPVPEGDAFVFMPAAIALKSGHGLTNPFWTMHEDISGQNRFLDHPPLFQMVVAACMWRSETRNAFVVLAIFNFLTLLLYSVFLCSAQFTRKLIASRDGFAVLLWSLIGIAFLIFTSSSGRPENLSMLAISLGMVVAVWLRQKWWPIWFGLVIGFTGAIHPTHGIFTTCLALVTFSFTAAGSKAFAKTVLSIAIALPLFFILLRLSPYSLTETLRAVFGHGMIANAPDYRLSSLGYYYLKLAPWSGIYLLGLSLVFVWWAMHLWQSAQNSGVRWFRLGALALTTLMFWFFSIRRPTASYYVMLLAPAIAASALYLLSLRCERDHRLAAVPVWVIMAFSSALILWLGRDIALFINYRSKGVSFADAQKELDVLIRSTDRVIFVSESFWVLTHRFDKIQIVERGTAAGDIMVLQQGGRSSLSPPTFPSYRVLSDRFVRHPPTCFGLPIGRTMPGYAFAVLTREN